MSTQLELEIDSSHPWFERVWNGTIAAAQWLPGDVIPEIVCSVMIGGIEEFFKLDTVYEITSFELGKLMVNTRWQRVRGGRPRWT